MLPGFISCFKYNKNYSLLFNKKQYFLNYAEVSLIGF